MKRQWSNAALFTVLVGSLSASAQAKTITVTNNNDRGPGSLRNAIVEANATTEADTIQFDIAGRGVQTIKPESGLPAISAPLTVDGSSQPGYEGKPLIQLEGRLQPGVPGLLITGGNSVVNALIISNFLDAGILIDGEVSGAGGNQIYGCYIGTDPTGTQRQGNTSGIRINRSANNSIGRRGGNSSAPEVARNVISGNMGSGIDIVDATGAASERSGNNNVSGNYIGVDATGTKVLFNSAYGVVIDRSSNNLIGALHAGFDTDHIGELNVIGGNRSSGILINGEEAVGNTIVGNYIGTSGGSTPVALPNRQHGIEIFFARDTKIGSIYNQSGRNGFGNVIGHNGENGIFVFGISATGTQILANSIGVSSDLSNYSSGFLTTSIPNGGDGIQISGASNTTIGVSTLGSVPELDLTLGNLIGSNRGCGIRVTSGEFATASNNLIVGNYIGTNPTNFGPNPGARLGNGLDGIRLINARNTSIGSIAQGVPRSESYFSNLIQNNAANGVTLIGGLNNVVSVNSIDANGKLGIDLNNDGVTRNDDRDADDGANNNLNAPEILSAGISNEEVAGVPTVKVQARYRGLPNTNIGISYYATNLPDSSGYGEGRRYLSGAIVKTDANGLVNAPITFASRPVTDPLLDIAVLRQGEYLTATATVANVGTSEFSNIVRVSPDGVAPTISITTPTANQTISAFTKLEGNYADNKRLNRIEIFIQRRSDNKFFDGNGWVSTAPRLRAFIVTERVWRYTGPFPIGDQLESGLYTITAIAFDDVQNRGIAQTNIRISTAPPLPSGLAVSILSPRDGDKTTSLQSLQGLVQAFGGAEVQRVELVILRRSDNKYFNGSDWSSSTSVRLPATVSSNSWKYENTELQAGAVQPGNYTITAVAYDTLRRRFSRTVNVTVIVAAQSTLQAISTSAALADTSTVELVFASPLKPELAADVTRYAVEVNGQSVTPEAAWYQASSKVTLLLPESTLRRGDRVKVQWTELQNTQGVQVAGKSTLTAR